MIVGVESGEVERNDNENCRRKYFDMDDGGIESHAGGLYILMTQKMNKTKNYKKKIIMKLTRFKIVGWNVIGASET